jgi:hypothetical protein
MNAEQCSNQTIKDLLSGWEKGGLFQNNNSPVSDEVEGSGQKQDERQQQDKVFTQHHQIPPKK